MMFHKLSVTTLFCCGLVAVTGYGALAWAADEAMQWVGCGITKKAFMAELAAAYKAKTGIDFELKGGGATKGIRDTAMGKAHMGGSCRMALPFVQSSEDYVKLTPIAWDALVVIVHKNNPVNSLTTDQVRDIYLGKVTNWKEVGGRNAPMELYVRKGKISGVGYAIRQYLFGQHNVRFKTDKSRIVASSGPLEKAVEERPNAIGITGVSSARKRNVKLLDFQGMSPTYENIRDGKYTMYRPLYLVTPRAPSAEVQAFVDFATSEEGRRILRENNVVPYKDALHLMSGDRVYGLGN